MGKDDEMSETDDELARLRLEIEHLKRLESSWRLAAIECGTHRDKLRAFVQWVADHSNDPGVVAKAGKMGAV
jgi:hypothetical protein